MTDTPHNVASKARHEIAVRLRCFASTADAAAIRSQRDADSERFRRDAYLEAAAAVEGLDTSARPITYEELNKALRAAAEGTVAYRPMGTIEGTFDIDILLRRLNERAR